MSEGEYKRRRKRVIMREEGEGGAVDMRDCPSSAKASFPLVKQSQPPPPLLPPSPPPTTTTTTTTTTLLPPTI